MAYPSFLDTAIENTAWQGWHNVAKHFPFHVGGMRMRAVGRPKLIDHQAAAAQTLDLLPSRYHARARCSGVSRPRCICARYAKTACVELRISMQPHTAQKNKKIQ